MDAVMQVPEFVRGKHFVNRRDLTVEWGHCDPAGIVFHPRFIEYFDWCCVLLIERATGLKKSELRAAYGFAGIPIVDMQVRFLAAVSYNDDVQIYSTISDLKRSSFAVRHCLVKQGKAAVECAQTRVWCIADPDDPRKLKSSPLPDEVVKKLTVS
jgi:4-hydroxybenzoyl-CoA thioesterase